TDDRLLVLLDPMTGKTTWSGTGAPQDLSTVHETTWHGRPVLAAASSQEHTLWPLDSPDPTAVAPVTVDLRARAHVTYAGTAPLIDLGDYTVLAPATATTDSHRLSLPPGSRPAALTENTIHSITDDQITHTNTTTGESTTTDLTSPQHAENTPDMVIGIDDTRALVQWPTGENNENILALTDLETGTLLAEPHTTQSLNDNDTLLIDNNAQTATIRTYFLAYDNQTAIVDLGRFEPTALRDHQLFGTGTDT